MTDNDDDLDRTLIRLPTAGLYAEQGEDLGATWAREWNEEKRQKIDEMFARVERGEFSEEELQLIKLDAVCRALHGHSSYSSPESIPPWIQPLVRKALEMDMEAWSKVGQTVQ